MKHSPVRTPVEDKRRRTELREKLYRRRFLVPNLVTVGNMFCGFLGIMYATTARPTQAIAVLVLAIILDGLDGRVARRLNATSEFGGEFDSFSDFISFGVAPAVLMYHWAFHPKADEFGVFVVFLYVLCAAGRLVRFNISEENLSAFNGLPSPAAAGGMLVLINLNPYVEADFWLRVVASATTFLIAYLMVCSIPYRSIKQLQLKAFGSRVQILLGMCLVAVWYKPKEGLLALMLAYILSGPFLHAFGGEEQEDEEA